MGSKKVPLPKICHTYTAMVKLGAVIPYLKKIQRMHKTRDTPLISADISDFLPEISKFCYIKKCRYRLHFCTEFLNFFGVYKDCFNKYGYNFDDASKTGNSKAFLPDAIIFVQASSTKFYHVTQIMLKIWSCDQTLVTLAFL